MITEFSFSGFPHPGHRSSLFVDVFSQENRGVGYRKYVLQAARAPFMVGMHWFMWMDYAKQDQAIRGFPPDENVGLVSHDEAATYEELGRWAAHRGARWVVPPRQRLQGRPLKRFTPTVDGDVSEWPKELALKPALVTALTDGVKVDHTYFMAWDKRYVYLAGDISDSRLDHPGKDRAWQGDYLAVSVSPVKAAASHMDSASTIVIYPQGGGTDGQQPYAVRRYGPQPDQELAIRVKKQLKPGGYTLEARIPTTAIHGFKRRNGALWKITLVYQNVNEIYRAHWESSCRIDRLCCKQ
jgi:Carbohydrate family 9 binding domain-like